MKVGIYEKDQNRKSFNSKYSKIVENKDEIPTRKDFSRKNPLERTKLNYRKTRGLLDQKDQIDEWLHWVQN